MPVFMRPEHGPLLCVSARQFIRWAFQPYGIWTTEDGREVLFNRDYQPIWQRRSGEPPEPADRKEWVKGILSQRWFYKDGTPESQKHARGAAILAEWGVRVPDRTDVEPWRMRRDRFGQLVMAKAPLLTRTETDIMLRSHG